MLLFERQAQVAEMVRQQDFIRVEVLAHHFNVTTQIGTTPEIVSKALLGHQHLRIFTHNLNIAMLEQSGAQLIVCKGELSP